MIPLTAQSGISHPIRQTDKDRAAPARPDRWEQALSDARKLCAKMTLEEKAGELMVYDYRDLGEARWEKYEQMVRDNAIGAMMRVKDPALTRRMQEFKMAHSRLGIPLMIHEDVVHGYSTSLPIQIALACSWDDEAVERAEAVAAREAAVSGINMTYSPQCDISCDPRWGRIGSTLGEDPYLSARMTAARVRGSQGRSLDELADGRHVLACVKHFAGYGSLQGAKDYRHQDFSRRELLETHLPPFRAAVDAGAMAVMNAYTAFEGQPCNFSRYLLTDLLRGEMGFRGQLVTDWTTLQFSVDEGAAQDLDDAAVRGLQAGVDMDMISGAFLRLPELVRRKKVSEKLVDAAVIRSLALKYLMGLFDDPYRYCDEQAARSELFSRRNQAEVLDVARKSLVLLKNEGGLLPLDPGKDVLLTGPWADDALQLGGGSNKDVFHIHPEERPAEGSKVVTIKGAMRKRWGDRLDCGPINPVAMARGEGGLGDAEVAILTIGEPGSYTGERRGRARLTIPEDQLEQLRTLKRAGKKVVSLVFAGRPFLMNEIVWLSDAVLLVWYPGAMGGEAIAEVLSGEVNPSGKLSQHIPLDVGQIPLSYRQKRTFIACSYTDLPAQPLFPFGFGLSYTTFRYSTPVVERQRYNVGEPVSVSVEVTNTGSRPGREVVQLYLRDEVASILPRERELREYASVTLAPGQAQTVRFILQPEAFALYDAQLNKVIEPGDFTIFIGPDSNTRNAVRVTLE